MQSASWPVAWNRSRSSRSRKRRRARQAIKPALTAEQQADPSAGGRSSWPGRGSPPTSSRASAPAAPPMLERRSPRSTPARRAELTLRNTSCCPVLCRVESPGGVCTAAKDVVRVAALGDLHYGRTAAAGSLQPLFAQINEAADMLVAVRRPDRLRSRRGGAGRWRASWRRSRFRWSPCSAITTSSRTSRTRSRKILADAGVTMLDGDTTEIHGIGFAGVKGFAGGFGRRALGPWGEDDHQEVRARSGGRGAEARIGAGAAAERAADRASCTTPRSRRRSKASRCEIFPFLGCSRLEEPLTRYPVTAVFHGHAHHGRPEGRTRTDVPVFNVSMSLMRELFPERPFRVVEVPMRTAARRCRATSAAGRRRLVTGSLML